MEPPAEFEEENDEDAGSRGGCGGYRVTIFQPNNDPDRKPPKPRLWVRVVLATVAIGIWLDGCTASHTTYTCVPQPTPSPIKLRWLIISATLCYLIVLGAILSGIWITWHRLDEHYSDVDHFLFMLLGLLVMVWVPIFPAHVGGAIYDEWSERRSKRMS